MKFTREKVITWLRHMSYCDPFEQEYLAAVFAFRRKKVNKKFVEKAFKNYQDHRWDNRNQTYHFWQVSHTFAYFGVPELVHGLAYIGLGEVREYAWMRKDRRVPFAGLYFEKVAEGTAELLLTPGVDWRSTGVDARVTARLVLDVHFGRATPATMAELEMQDMTMLYTRNTPLIWENRYEGKLLASTEPLIARFLTNASQSKSTADAKVIRANFADNSRLQEVLNFTRDHMAKYKEIPGREVVRRALRMSPNSVSKAMGEIIARGLLHGGFSDNSENPENP